MSRYPNDAEAPAEAERLNVTVNDDDDVLALIYADPTDVYLRLDGSWVPEPVPADPRIDGTQWLNVTDEFVDVFDQEPEGLTRSDVERFVIPEVENTQ